MPKYSEGDNCPVNETPDSFKEKTGKTCYEPCPPGRERDPNNNNICVRACRAEYERDLITGDCKRIE